MAGTSNASVQFVQLIGIKKSAGQENSSGTQHLQVEEQSRRSGMGSTSIQLCPSNSYGTDQMPRKCHKLSGYRSGEGCCSVVLELKDLLSMQSNDFACQEEVAVASVRRQAADHPPNSESRSPSPSVERSRPHLPPSTAMGAVHAARRRAVEIDNILR